MRLLVSPELLRQGGALHFSPPWFRHAADLSLMYGVAARPLAPPRQIYEAVCCETSPPALKLPEPRLRSSALLG